jgi:ligand-binding SRPBCC domain-containing protein
MALIIIETPINAPPERCFDLARSVDLHIRSTAATTESAVAGITAGLLGPGDQVTWRGRHLGAVQELTCRITQFDSPRHFRDSLLRGAFKELEHDHYFEEAAHGTLMRDLFNYRAPFGPAGWLAERLFMTRYLRRFLATRCRIIRQVAESEEWRRFLSGGESTAQGTTSGG